MELVPSNTPLSFEVTFDQPGLNVGMVVYDDTSGSPTLVFGPIPMTNVVGNTYRAKFTASDGRSYIVMKGVYTDSSLTVLNSNYSQGSESIIAQTIGGGSSSGGGGSDVIGFVSDLNNNVIGFVGSNC